jgi:hypothetical protein
MRLPPFVPVLARPELRKGTAIQVGVSRAVVLEGLSLDECAFLASLEGGRAVAPHERSRFAAIIASLSLAGAWAEPPPLREAVAVFGCGALGVEIAAALDCAGCLPVLVDDAPASAEPPHTFVENGGTCAGEAARTLAARGVHARVGGAARLAVIVCTGAPDPVVVRQLLRAGTPHILVACDEDGVFVSHVVVPGESACSRCRDIALTRADKAWPLLALQLAGSQLPSRRPLAPGLSRPATALLVAMRAARWLEAGDVGIGERIALDGTVAPAPLAAESACGCGAAGPVGDELAARRAAWRG